MSKKKEHCEIGSIGGKYYKLVYDKLNNQQACDTKHAKCWRWFLFVGGNTDDFYVGNFRTKTEALKMVT